MLCRIRIDRKHLVCESTKPDSGELRCNAFVRARGGWSVLQGRARRFRYGLSRVCAESLALGVISVARALRRGCRCARCFGSARVQSDDLASVLLQMTLA